MSITYCKKALIFQSLFFCLQLFAQTVDIASPKPGAPLDDPQLFRITTSGAMPTRVSVLLNGQTVATRTTPPFEFEITWNTALENTVKVVASYADGQSREIEARFAPIAVDLVETTTRFQCFPFPQADMTGNTLELISNQRRMQPEIVVQADPMPIDLWVVMDVSGSMHFYLEALSQPLKAVTTHRAEKGDTPNILLFDASPRIIDLKDFLQLDDLRTLYREQVKSAIFDALAATAMQMRGGARRVVLLISDGADDGSSHDAKTVAALLRQRQAILCWYNPAGLRNRALTRLVKRSGGFVLQGTPDKAFATLLSQLQNQLRVVATEVTYPIEMRLKTGKIIYPKWRE